MIIYKMVIDSKYHPDAIIKKFFLIYLHSTSYNDNID